MNVRAKARTYLRNKSNSKSKSRSNSNSKSRSNSNSNSKSRSNSNSNSKSRSNSNNKSQYGDSSRSLRMTSLSVESPSDGVHGLTAVDGFGERLVDEFAHLLGRDEVLGRRVLRHAAAGDVGGTGARCENLGDG